MEPLTVAASNRGQGVSRYPRHRLTCGSLVVSLVFTSPWSLHNPVAQETLRQEECFATPTASCLFEKAERIALSIGSEVRRARALAEIAVEYGQTAIEKAEPRARSILLRARTVASTLQDRANDDASSFIATAHARLGEVEQARAIAGGIDSADTRHHAISNIATVQAEQGDIVGALLTVSRINDTSTHGFALTRIALAQAEMDDAPGALRTARGIGTARLRDLALGRVGLTLVRQGHLTEALAAAEEAAEKAWHQWIVALAAVEAGDMERGLQTAVEIDDPVARRAALASIAEAIARDGDVTEGLRIANSLENLPDRLRAIADIAEAQAAMGNFVGARRTLRTIADTLSRFEREPPFDPMQRFGVLSVRTSLQSAATQIAVKQASAYDPTGAIVTATEFLTGYYLAVALARVAVEVDSGQ